MIEIKNLHISFGEKQVLKGLNLCVPKNSVFGFIGKNGAGKTTTMKAILGFITPDEGNVFVGGEEVVYGGTATNKYIGYLPDVPEFYSFMTANEFLCFCAELTGMQKDEITARVEEMLNLVGLENNKQFIKGFSRGMKQRLGIAQALLNRPKLLICDEPTSALDPIGRKEILEILKKISNETTVLFSTHILSDVEKICTDIAVLDEGVIKVQGKLDEIKSKYKTDEFLIEMDSDDDINVLLGKFEFIKVNENKQLTFSAYDNYLYDVLSFITSNKLSLIKVEKNEPTLESLFMEVVK